MNLKALTAPLRDKIGDLTGLVQDMTDLLAKQTKLQEEILEELRKKNVCKVEKTDD